MTGMQKTLRRFSIKDLILIAAMAGIGIAVKPIVLPVIHLFSSSLFIPGGALAGGLYMMWLVMAFGLTGKRGAATLAGLIQAIIVLITGISGSHGVMSLLSYTLPGAAIDLGLLLIRHRCCCMPCCFLAGLLANLVGTVCVNFIFFSMPLIPLLLSLLCAAFSGGVGGILSWLLLKALKKFNIGRKYDDNEDAASGGDIDNGGGAALDSVRPEGSDVSCNIHAEP